MAEGSAMGSDVVRIQDHVAVRVIAMNRPDKMNALNTALVTGLRDALAVADQDDGVRAIVLTGEGRGFSAGADLGEFRGEQTPDTVKRNAQRSAVMSGLQVMLRNLSKPVVAAVHGAAIGAGASFAICCDMVVAGTNLKFGYPELKHRLTPTAVLTSLIKQVGPKMAFEMVSLGANFGADDLLRLGLANRVVARGRSRPEAEELARRIAGFPQQCMLTDRRSAYGQWDLPLEAALRREGRDGAPMVAAEGKAGARRFVEGAGRRGVFD